MNKDVSETNLQYSCLSFFSIEKKDFLVRGLKKRGSRLPCRVGVGMGTISMDPSGKAAVT
jgi:hypothetical protein